MHKPVVSTHFRYPVKDLDGSRTSRVNKSQFHRVDVMKDYSEHMYQVAPLNLRRRGSYKAPGKWVWINIIFNLNVVWRNSRSKQLTRVIHTRNEHARACQGAPPQSKHLRKHAPVVRRLVISNAAEAALCDAARIQQFRAARLLVPSVYFPQELEGPLTVGLKSKAEPWDLNPDQELR